MEGIPHALVVPYSGQGHVNGCMLLAKALSALGFRVSFIFFTSYHATLDDKNFNILSSSNGDHVDTTSSFDGDGDADASGHVQSIAPAGPITIHVIEDGIRHDDTQNPFPFTPTMKDSLFNLILRLRQQGLPPTCLISDTFLHWTCQTAAEAGIPRIDFCTSNAVAYMMIATLAQLYSEGIFPEKGSRTLWQSEMPLMLDHIPGVPPFPSENFPKEMRFGDSSDMFVGCFLEMASCVKLAERVLIHTISEIEPEAMEACKMAGISAYAIGPLHQHAGKQQLASGEGNKNKCISWLDTQADCSVIYVAFGSQASLNIGEIQELALGLEASGNPFLWAIREGSYGDMELSKVLPEGFVERTRDRGMITGWAPQVEVLSHRAVGGFLSHCGWNSTLESLCAGIPILCCPQFAEQMSNTHYICKVWKVGLDMRRKQDGAIDKSFVEFGVKALMLEEEGNQARAKAQEVMTLALKTCQEGGQSMANLEKFYADMKARCMNT